LEAFLITHSGAGLLHANALQEFGAGSRGSTPFRCSTRFKPLGKPHLDDGLPGNTEFAGLTVQRLNHPGREIDIDTPLRLLHTPRLGQIKGGSDIDASIKLLFE